MAAISTFPWQRFTKHANYIPYIQENLKQIHRNKEYNF